MSILNETAPKRIWLCVSDDEDDNDKPYPELYAEDAEITWSTDQPVAVTVEYVRADIAKADLAAALERLDSVAERDRLAIAAVEGVQQMRIDLAAARALLREARDVIIGAIQTQRIVENIVQRIDAALKDKP